MQNLKNIDVFEILITQKLLKKARRTLLSDRRSYVLGAQKNRLIEAVLLSTHNICFGSEIRKLFFRYTLLTKVLAITVFKLSSEL